MSRIEPEERRLIENTVARLAESSFSIERCRSGDMEGGPEEWRRFAQHGLCAIGVPSAIGGVGGGAAEQAIVMRQIGRNLLALPYLDSVVLAGAAIRRFASVEQAQRRLPQLAAGDLRTSFAHREPAAGDDRGFVETELRNGRITGCKAFVLDAASASEFIVTARDERGELRLCFVAPDAEGLSLASHRAADGRLASTLFLQNVRCEPAPSIVDIDGLLDLASVCAAAESVGAMDALLQETLTYARTRRQFGTSIGSFQVIQHRLVDMFIAAQEASALVDDALDALDAGAPEAAFLVSAAKARADSAGRFIGESAIQIHGGMGMTDECAAGHYLKRLLTLGSQYGAAAWHIDRVARLAA
jgi:alkylation response protein AidB-like acyl-CoA dehydrogenase